MEIYKPYALQFISLLFLFFFFLFWGLKSKRNVAGICLFLLYLLIASTFILRDYYGNIDIPRYMKFYEENVTVTDIFSSGTAWKADYFFFLFMPLCHFFGLSAENYITFQLLLSIGLTFIAYFLVFKKSNKWIFLGLFFTLNSSSFYLIHGNVIRQGLASSLLLLSLGVRLPKTEFWLKVMGFFTHKGVILSFLPALLKKMRPYRLIILCVALFIGYFSMAIYFLNLFALPGFVQQKIAFYSIFQRASSNSLLKLLLLVLFNLLFLMKMGKHEVFKKTHDLFFIYSVVALLLFRFDGLFSRLVLYSDIFVPILTIGVITGIKNGKQRLFALLATIVLSIAYSVFTFNHESILFNMGEYLKF
ncbi:MAG: hypothetical protein CMH48_05715 [Muricauda sp.]|nr:EpsG family protein [Allomuricauda sp.]MBC30323.1 hypothetical protein [Allomuricauda sp.]|tara:strand:- start:344 stop:1426 length:1083 start_codon:yes stop_codon:yes gene_type:complete